MESVVQCCIHGEKMNEPIRTLPCLHSACLTCLKQYCATKLGNDLSNKTVKCPKCHDPFEVPGSSAGGVESMPINDFTAGAVAAANSTFNPNKIMCEMCDGEDAKAATSRCKECAQWACDGCQRAHLRMKVCMNHKFVTIEEAFKEGSTVLQTRVTHCQKHKHLEINAFCNSDNTAVCSECVVESHSGHTFDKLANVAKGFKDSVSSVVAKVKNTHGGLVPAMAEIDKSLKAVNEQAKKATDEIHKVCDELREYANERERQLKNEVEEIRKEKEKALIEQKRGMEILEVGIRESSAMVETMLKEGSETEIVASQKQVITRFTKLEEERKNVQLEPATDISLEFERDEGGMREAKERIMKIGSVVSKDISSEKSSVERQDQDQAGSIRMNQSYSFQVIVVDKKGNRVGKGKGSNSIPFTVGITAGNQPQQSSVSPLDGKEGEYSVSLTATQAGGHDVSVCHKGKHFKGSPFRIEVVDRPIYRRNYGGVGDQPVLRSGSQGSNDGQFINPYAVACNVRGDIVVCEWSNHRIQVFDKTGKFLFKFGSNGNGNGQFSNPGGVTVDQRNNQIVVADLSNDRVQIFDEKGVFIRSFGSQGNGDGQLDVPWGIVVDLHGNYLVAEYGNHRVQIFDSNGRFVRKFGSIGNGNGQFSGPIGIGLLSNGNIVVGEQTNNRVQIFDSTGNFIRIIGVGQMSNPIHLFVDSDNNILVADNGNNRIQVFKADGTVVKTIGAGQVSGPIGISMDGEGRIVVSENDAHRVSVF